ncbi:hypothetical protein B8A44_08075 [Dolosigranulum pigrum]|uniref:Uncharacterized protein n=1 Tax=Dolosigranulum pigrum TaxID=29394 RepID=A0A328KNB1_9LACT|nr:hypothetical protein [Dolosigranulum pigrum]RAN62219.1 hypothetical protein B8A44_08075 [Dolosigranulum pigrum]
MLIHLNKEIKLKDVTNIRLSTDEYNGYSIDNLIFDRYNLKCYQIPVTPTLRDLLNILVRLFVIQTLDYWSNILRIDELMPDEGLAEMMEQNFERLLQRPNLDVIAIEERTTHQLRIEIKEAARAFILDYYYRLSDEDREDFFDQYTEDQVFTVYYEPHEERFAFAFPGESYAGDDTDHFPCGQVVVSLGDVDEIFGQ